MIFHENRLPADNSHEISCLICYFLKSSKTLNCRLLQIIGGALWINKPSPRFVLSFRHGVSNLLVKIKAPEIYMH